MAEPAWQELLRLRLAERNAKDSAFAPIIEQCVYLPHLFTSSTTTDRLLIPSRSTARTTNKAFEGEKCFIATCSSNC